MKVEHYCIQDKVFVDNNYDYWFIKGDTEQSEIKYCPGCGSELSDPNYYRAQHFRTIKYLVEELGEPKIGFYERDGVIEAIKKMINLKTV